MLGQGGVGHLFTPVLLHSFTKCQLTEHLLPGRPQAGCAAVRSFSLYESQKRKSSLPPKHGRSLSARWHCWWGSGLSPRCPPRPPGCSYSHCFHFHSLLDSLSTYFHQFKLLTDFSIFKKSPDLCSCSARLSLTTNSKLLEAGVLWWGSSVSPNDARCSPERTGFLQCCPSKGLQLRLFGSGPFGLPLCGLMEGQFRDPGSPLCGPLPK